MGAVGALLLGLFLFTGVWPPMVVVESGSMMHAACPSPVGPACDPAVGFGRLGTIDPGDLVVVRAAPRRDDVVTFAEGLPQRVSSYGRPGDVVVYHPWNDRGRTPIIHRAMTFVEVEGVADPEGCARAGAAGPGALYRVQWDSTLHTFHSNEAGIVLPSLGLEGYRPCWSGYITQGDNPVTNRRPDQATPGGALPGQPVAVTWLVGKAVGELPWFGLVKLALGPSPNYSCGSGAARAGDPACHDAVRILNANGPADLWAMLGVSLTVIVAAPLLADVWRGSTKARR